VTVVEGIGVTMEGEGVAPQPRYSPSIRS
jgi:hypothetical protein